MSKPRPLNWQITQSWTKWLTLQRVTMPGTDIPAILHSAEGKRVMQPLQWGLVPHWAKDPGIGAKLSNARLAARCVQPSTQTVEGLLTADNRISN